MRKIIAWIVETIDIWILMLKINLDPELRNLKLTDEQSEKMWNGIQEMIKAHENSCTK